jgi:hypothetical protein
MFKKIKNAICNKICNANKTIITDKCDTPTFYVAGKSRDEIWSDNQQDYINVDTDYNHNPVNVTKVFINGKCTIASCSHMQEDFECVFTKTICKFIQH